MLRLVLVLGVAVVGAALSGCGCFDEPGNVYTCTCERRCQGTTATWTTSSGCVAQQSTAVSGASSNCVRSCTPEASCTSCTCTRGAACTIDKRCR